MGFADPADVLDFLKRKSKDERMAARYVIYASVRRARDEEKEPRTDESPTTLAFKMAKLPADMNRVILEFKLGVVVRRPVEGIEDVMGHLSLVDDPRMDAEAKYGHAQTSHVTAAPPPRVNYSNHAARAPPAAGIAKYPVYNAVTDGVEPPPVYGQALPPAVNRVILEFKLGVVVQR
ncbi:hypothetical protein TeGR_g15111 [Tetraparma gracilis]|uniref:Uncharacterized protein n=1 Tax=Tetraparma gracilis TaxID=2962635 RepID=A0ABQ6MTY4_9STRA|nr:hypothetical protein TeGR_g15111 [Tetraparma gracilis]